MASILDSIQKSINNNLFSPASALEINRMQYYSINGTPMLTYGLLGITTVVLATVTLSESVPSEPEEKETSLVSQLPNINPFSQKEVEPSEQKTVGGKPRKTKSNKHKSPKHNKTRGHRGS
jgi:hypothetical protein